MIAWIKLWSVPVWASLVAAASVGQFAQVVNIIAVVTIIAGVLVVARYRAALDASDKAGAAAMRERDVERVRSERLSGDISELQQKVLELQALPDLDEHAKLLAGQTEIINKMLNQIAAHDENVSKLFARHEMLLTTIIEKLHVVGG